MAKPLALSAYVSLAFLAPAAHAANVIADFNDLNQSNLGAFNAGAGQAGGTGLDPGETWANTGTIDVIAGDLTAPAATGYALTQGGTPQSAQGDFSSGLQTTRGLTSTLTGTVWFSFLVNQPTTNSRGGITFNQNVSGPGDPRIVFTGADLRLGISVIQPPGGGANNIITLGEDHLVLGRITLDPAGDEALDIWIDPDLSTGPGGLGAPDNFLVQQSASLDAGINRLGIQSYSSDGQGGIVDAVYVSDGANAFFDVTGVIPEPGTPALLALASLLCLRRRRR